MVNIESIATSLVNKEATVANVAKIMGRLGERLGAEYPVDIGSSNTEASIGVRNPATSDAAPEYVQISWKPPQTQTLAQVVPSCKHWQLTPTNPGANPYRYSCHFEGSSADIDITFLSDLTHDIYDPAADVVAVLIQRNVMR